MDDVESSPPTAATPSPHQLDDAEIDQLGRQRPEIFKNAYIEVGFCASILMSSILAEFLISGFNVLLPNVIEKLHIDPSDRTWPANVFSLVTGAFLLPFGRLADIYGGYIVFISGLVWMAIWSLVAGFSQNFLMLVFCRALQGTGAAAFMPSGMMLLATAYRPGPRKNTIFSLYGGCAPFGFFFGIFLAGVTSEYLHWGWFFWIGTMLLAIVIMTSWLCVPHQHQKELISMDWLGCGTSILALILLVYAITDSAHVSRGWASPQILVTSILGVLLLGAFVYVEGWVAKHPILPFSLFKPKYMKPLVLCLFLCYGSFGIYLFYVSFYMETVLNISPILSTAWFAPMATGGIIIAVIGGSTLHRLPGTILLMISCLGYLVSCLLFALIPEKPNYWAWVFPAMICATIGIDIMYNVSNIFITSNVPRHQQGLAGACINGILFLSMSFFLGFADYGVARQSHTALRESFKVAFWMGVACAGAGVLLVLVGVRIGKARSDLTMEEKKELGEEALERRMSRNQSAPSTVSSINEKPEEMPRRDRTGSEQVDS